MGVYENVKKALQDIVAPELQALRVEIKRLDEKIDSLREVEIKRLDEKIDSQSRAINEKVDSLREVEIKRLDEKIDSQSRAINEKVDSLREVFVPKMPVVKIIDLLEVIEESLGFKNGIEEIGIKPGEKLYEELMTKDEERRSLERDDMFIILPPKKFGSGRYFYPDVYISKGDNHCSSENGEFLNKEEIKELLRKENLI